ncbi:MAG: hypothetical protein QM490_06270 [Candidatus Gracilibacteria bacterium]
MSSNGFKNTAAALALTASLGMATGAEAGGESTNIQQEIDQVRVETQAKALSLLEECDANDDGTIKGKEVMCKIKRGIRITKEDTAEKRKDTAEKRKDTAETEARILKNKEEIKK